MSVHTTGSKIWDKMHAAIGHLIGGHGLAKEIKDVREDINAAFGDIAAITVEEFTAPLGATGSTVVLAGHVSPVALQVLSGAGLDGTSGPGPITISPPRPLSISCSDHAATWVGGATVTGTYRGAAQVEVIAFTNNATQDGSKPFDTVTSISIPAQADALGTFSMGTTVRIGLAKKLKVRAATVLPIREITDGVVPAAGAFDNANNTYIPAVVANGAHNYAVYYEWDASATPDA